MAENELRKLIGKPSARFWWENQRRVRRVLWLSSELMHRMIPATDLENRVTKLEQQLEEHSNSASTPTDPTGPGTNQSHDGTDSPVEDENMSGFGKGAAETVGKNHSS